MTQASQEIQEEENTYYKSIDELIEDAEIEAEIETEKKIRSKNTRVLTISLIAVALIAFIFLQVRSGSKATSSSVEKGVPLPELAAVPTPEPQAPAIQPEELIIPPEPSPVEASATPSASEEKPNQEPAQQEAVPEEVAAAKPEVPKLTIPELNVPDASVPDKKADAKVQEPAIEKPPVVTQSPPKTPAAPPVKKAVKEVKPVKTVKASPPSRNDTQTRQYHIQLGVFSVKDNANRFSKRIKDKGFTPSVQPKSLDMVRHVVYVGGFSSKQAGNNAVADLKAKGFNPVLEKMGQNPNTIVLGKFKDAKQADALQNKLSVYGYLSSTKKSRVQDNIHVVQIGPFKNLPQAQKTQKDIDRAGFNNTFIR